ncbi:MAG TPA: HAMP domain-containing sensor histidine kinase, partial [Vicinamibacterales bacterium]|nr:HAMP domain-containing sensor histidine kinase [Vicinamibacterales bacterium]
DPIDRQLFAQVANALPAEQAGRVGVTVYDPGGRPIAWAGRVSSLPKSLITGLPALVTIAGALGPRLVRVEPVSVDTKASTRDATVVVEESLADPQPTPGPPDTAVIPTSLVPVTVRTPFATRDTAPDIPQTDNYMFAVLAPSGAVLADAEVSRQDVRSARAVLRSRTWALSLAIFSAALLLAIGPLLNRRRRTRARGEYISLTAAIAVAVVIVRHLTLTALSAVADVQPLDSPLNVFVTGLTTIGLVALAVTTVERWRLSRPRPHAMPANRLRAAGLFLAMGAIGAAIVVAYERFLQRAVTLTHLDVLHFSLHPFDVQRFAVGFGLIAMHAAVIWGVALLLYTSRVWSRVPRMSLPGVAWVWFAAAFAVVFTVWRSSAAVPLVPSLIAVTMAGVCALGLASLARRARRASQAGRLGVLFLMLAAPSIALYPSLFAFGTAGKERIIETEYAPQALTQRDEVIGRLYKALDEIDALPTLVDFLRPTSGSSTERALQLWLMTDLAQYRLTSAIELYGADGSLVSRFALNLPEYTTPRHESTSCEWEGFEEVLPFGASERHVPQASRAICEHGIIRGSIVVRAMLDYRSLPFLSSQNPYLESLRPERAAAPEGSQGNDIEFVAYGWSRAPFNVAGTSTWPLSDDVFRRAVASRTPFWATLPRSGSLFRVYFTNDRGGIYAIGYPVMTWFGHLVNLAELMVLVAVLYVLLLAGSALFSLLTSLAPASGRELLREFRSSFYRKLFLAYVAAAVVPVALLAFGVRTYFARQAQADLEDSAARTATVAQRLVEDYASLQQRGASTLGAIDDPLMVLVSRAIGQDVNLFEGSGLEASSQRDLFASGLFSMRTPSSAYRAVVLERLPVFVGREQIADFPYRIAAAPIRAGGREGIVIVPLPLGQQQLDRQIDELDRQVIFGAVLVMLVGAYMGYFMTERIADPINRLSHATRRIAHGDLDARIAVASADELGRLVQDFNVMAGDLKRQRTELERTQRLEAWAEMARQVAHDIKNPLTPIQLSAEHAQRVNADRGRPLSPALDECVTAILHQVTLLRQIASEFSSFASSPTARPEPTSLPVLLEGVVSPYRTALAGRVELSLDVPADLPMVVLDRNLFARAVTNVMENALHAMPGGGTLAIRARCSLQSSVGSLQPAVSSPQSAVGSLSTDSSQTVTVEVTDTGVGMDAEAVGRIFEPYFSTKATGTGLGLTIAKRNIELTGGTIDVTSAKGVGTTVTITLPAVQAVV